MSETVQENTTNWIEFEDMSMAYPEKVTKTWYVNTKEGDSHLGTIKWFGRWRGYAFFPSPGTLFEKVCLRDLADFIESQNIAHRKSKAK